jgi:hypothetical protein
VLDGTSRSGVTVNNLKTERTRPTGWDDLHSVILDLRSIALLVPLVGAATAVTWLISRGVGATDEVSTAVTATAALTTALFLESLRRNGVEFFARSDQIRYLGSVTRFRADCDLNELLLDDAWTSYTVATFAKAIPDNLKFEAIVWLSGTLDPAASDAYPLHRAVEDVLEKSMQAVFIDEGILDFDDMTIMTRLSRDASVLLVQITANGQDLASRANVHIEDRTHARVGGYMTLFEKPETLMHPK